MQMAKSKFLRADLIMALLAVIIGLCTMFVYIYQASIMSKQMHMTAWPYLETNFSSTNSSFTVNVLNKGIGPAIIKKAYIIVDDVPYEDTKPNVDSISYRITGLKNILNGYTNLQGRVMAANDVVQFIEVTDSTKLNIFLMAMRKHKVRIEICYCSVFNECWKATGGNVEPCKSCE